MRQWFVGLCMVFGFLVAGCAHDRAALADGVHAAAFEGGRVAYQSRGTGEPAIVFVHGWSCDRSFFAAQMADDALAKGRWLIAIDLPGHGGSEPPKGPITLGLEARAVASVLDDAGVKRAVLVGHSNGTPVVREFYREFPARTAGLVFVDGSLRPFFDSRQEWEQFIAPLRGPDYQEQAGRFLNSMLSAVEEEDEKEHIRTVMLSTPQRVMVGEMEAIADPAGWKPDQISVPALAVMAKSPFWTPEYEAYAKKLAPRLEYHVMDDVSHFLMMDKPREFDEILADWLKRQGW